MFLDNGWLGGHPHLTCTALALDRAGSLAAPPGGLARLTDAPLSLALPCCLLAGCPARSWAHWRAQPLPLARLLLQVDGDHLPSANLIHTPPFPLQSYLDPLTTSLLYTTHPLLNPVPAPHYTSSDNLLSSQQPQRRPPSQRRHHIVVSQPGNTHRPDTIPPSLSPCRLPSRSLLPTRLAPPLLTAPPDTFSPTGSPNRSPTSTSSEARTTTR